MLRPEGLNNILVNDTDNSMVVEATPAAHAALKQLLPILDLLPKSVLVKMRLVQKGKVIMAPVVATKPNQGCNKKQPATKIGTHGASQNEISPAPVRNSRMISNSRRTE